MLRHGALPPDSSHCSVRWPSATHITDTRRTQACRPQSGQHCTKRCSRTSTDALLTLTRMCLMLGATLSSACTGLCSYCSRASTPRTERHHQHLSTSPPHTSTPHSEHSWRASAALASLSSRALRCRCADAGWAEAEGCGGESGLFAASSANVESAHW